MYSSILGAHQKINRVSRKHLAVLNDAHGVFPNIKEILKFEGKNGPDGIKRKSPAQDEPWHYYDPFDEDDSGLLDIIEEHYKNLVAELKSSNKVRSAFEASWLAHALVDGLTPAHHYPYEEGLNKIYGAGMESRDTKLKKIVVPSKGMGLVTDNWKMWGAKGLLSTHMLFEGGAALIMLPSRHKLSKPTGYDVKTLQKVGIVEFFKRTAREVALLNMYERFYETGWNTKLAQEIRDELAPRMIKTVTLAWHAALTEAS